MSSTAPYTAYRRRRLAQQISDEQRRQATREAGRATAEFARLHSDVLRSIAEAGLAAAEMADQAYLSTAAKH